MKYTKLAIIMVSSLVLFSCDNFQKKNVGQEFTIKMMKKELPIEYDEYTTLTDVYAIDDMLVYKYDFKGLDEEILKSKEYQDDVREDLVIEYCNDNEDINSVKKAFPNGLKFIYFLNNKEVSSITVNPGDCKK